jgi:hypothetical protein
VCFRNKDTNTFEQFLQVIDQKTTGAPAGRLAWRAILTDVYQYVQFAELLSTAT